MSIKIAVTYEKGGVGKTTTAVNLSAILAERGFKVLLVDLDCQSYATSYFDLYDEALPSIDSVMRGTSSARDTIRLTKFGFDLLPSVYPFKTIEDYLHDKKDRQEQTLKNALFPIDSDYDYIIIDCPTNGYRIKENMHVYTDYLILVTIPDDNALQGLLCIAKDFVDIKRNYNSSLEVLGVLITMKEHTAIKVAYSQALHEQEIFPCFQTEIRKNSALSSAQNLGKPINKHRQKSNGCLDYRSLADEVIEKTVGSNLGEE